MGKDSYRFIAIFFSSFVVMAHGGQLRAQGHASARVEALGGDAVTGIVRDTLTDIYLSPAFLASCDRFTINYGQRRSPELYLGFPNLHKENRYAAPFTRLSYYSIIEEDRSNELTAYGIGIGSWRLAASVEWRLGYTERSNPDYYSYSGYVGDISQTYYHLAETTDSRYVRADITAARELGLRIGGSTAENEHSRTLIQNAQRFGIVVDPYELIQEYRSYDYEMLDDTRSISGGFAQAGLLHGSDGSIRSLDLRVARYDIYLRESAHDILSRTWNDEWGDPESYERSELQWRDDRYGTMWSYDITGRIWSETGIRIVAGLGFEHMAYDTKWRDILYKYDWQPWAYSYQEWDYVATMVFDGEGEYTGMRAFLELGRAARLRDDLEITAGIHAAVETHRTEEEPTARITLCSTVNGSLFAAELEKQLVLTTEWTETVLGIPAAIEFEPAHWVSIWTGFMVYSRYFKLDDEMPDVDVRKLENITSYLELEDYASLYEVFQMEDVTVASTATVGVSLHYRDRFFVDLYTASDITPDDLARYVLDVRYAF
jgi:hypothetical protein